MISPSKLKFFDDKTKKRFFSLETSREKEKSVFKSLSAAFKNIEENAFCGIQIPKRLIPRDYLKNFQINNLWKYNLPRAWRLLYSIERDELIMISIIIEWLGHKEYERRFNY